MRYARHQASSARLVGAGLVVLLHIGIIYALVTGLAHRVVDVVRAPIETKIIDEARPEKPPPPPPPPEFTPPPPAFVPPPEIHIETPPPPPKSTAITVVTPEKPVAQPPAPVPVVEGVRVTPKYDAKHSQELEYPPTSRRLGEEGSVVVQVLVDVDGRVLESKLVQSSGFDRLDQAALNGVKTNYRFAAGTVDGKPQPMWYTIKYTWKLR
jgi:protein TonB